MTERESSEVPVEIDIKSIFYDLIPGRLKIHTPPFVAHLTREQYEELSRQKTNYVGKGKRAYVVVKGQLEIKIVPDTEK